MPRATYGRGGQQLTANRLGAVDRSARLRQAIATEKAGARGGIGGGLDDSLINFWRFDETGGQDQRVDEKGGIDWIVGTGGDVLSTAGVNDTAAAFTVLEGSLVQSAAPISPPAVATIAGWIWIEDGGSTVEVFADKEGGVAGTYGWRFAVFGSRLRFRYSSSTATNPGDDESPNQATDFGTNYGTDNTGPGDATNAQNVWTFVVARVAEGAEVEILSTVQNEPLRLTGGGVMNMGGDSFFDNVPPKFTCWGGTIYGATSAGGKIDSMGVYSKILDDAELAYLYNAGAGRDWDPDL